MAASAVKSGALLLALGGLSAAVGYLVLGAVGLVLAIITVAVLTAASLQLSDRLIMRLHGAMPLPPWAAPGLARLVDALSARAGIRTPRLYVIPALEANAMTTGSRYGPGALAVTEGLLRLLSPAELAGVLAHEVAHLRNRDTAIVRAAGAISGVVLMMAKISLWFALLATLLTGGGMVKLMLFAVMALALPFVVDLLRAALSRTREYAADATAAGLTGDPLALASALGKLERQRRWSLAALFGMPAGPPLLRSHPVTAQRIARLHGLTGPQSAEALIRYGRPRPADLFGNWLVVRPLH